MLELLFLPNNYFFQFGILISKNKVDCDMQNLLHIL